MPRLFGTLRRLVLTPSMASITFAHRGFPVTPDETTERLEAIPRSVVCGFEWGIEIGRRCELERRLDLVQPDLRGFAYEGATMAATVRDVLPGGGGRTRDLLHNGGRRHIFLAYIGIGFAMARLPKPLWRKVLPDLSESPYHPVMSWLAVDGYGFDRAYFDTARWVGEQQVPAAYPWQGSPEYFPRAFDQGVGRALWFVHGGRADAVAAAVHRFAESRRPDLWSGVGLAATFAGGAPGLARLRELSGPAWPELALGVVFAIKARDYAGHVPQHSVRAAGDLARLSVREAVGIADGTAPAPVTGVVPARERAPEYERWRERIRARLTASALGDGRAS